MEEVHGLKHQRQRLEEQGVSSMENAVLTGAGPSEAVQVERYLVAGGAAFVKFPGVSGNVGGWLSWSLCVPDAFVSTVRQNRR